jgi:pimeloyl-ACP methyl ester carboxylesterase
VARPAALAASAALAAGVALALTGCVTKEWTPDPGSRTASSTGAGQTQAEPDDRWERCTVASGSECATLAVPVDWADPDGATIELALARVPATDQANKLGSLLINPGGPGASGVSFLSYVASIIGKDVKTRYDIVGFDPRGVGGSAPITCYTSTEDLDRYFAADWPRTPEGFEESLAVVEPFARACEENTGPILAHVDTVSAAKDMEAIRQFVGDAKLNFLGYSYGTLLGATYADLFPANVGRFVLDGALDPSIDSALHEVEQAAGFELALESYLRDCLGSSYCPFGGTLDAAKAEIHQFLLDVQANPVPVGAGDDRELNLPLAMSGIFLALYDETSWPLLTAALANALDFGDMASLMFLSDQYYDRSDAGYGSNQMEAFIAINCLDDPLPSDLASAEAHAAALKQASPTFGEFWAYSEKQCGVWPYPPVGSPHAITAAGAEPIVVIGTTGDPATPYHGAVALAEQLESGVLVTYQGEGHTAYGRSNRCVAAAVETYLTEGKVPPDGLTC